MTAIHFFLKFCRKEEYAREFVAGRLRMNPLGYFRKLEDPSDGRSDPQEGANRWLQPLELEVQIGNIRIAATNLADPVVVQADELDALNVLCLYAVKSADFETALTHNMRAFRDHMRVPQQCLDMGRVGVLVHDVPAFQGRVIKAAKRQCFGLEAGLVKYFDAKRFSGAFPDPVFAKRREFAWQREYRFALNRPGAEQAPYNLNVGALDDICTIIDALTINE